MTIHPGWVPVLKDKRLQIRLWKDLAVVRVTRVLRMTRSARRKHEMRWVDLQCATLHLDPLRRIAQGDRVIPDGEDGFDDVWVYSQSSFQEAIHELQGLTRLLERAGIPSPHPPEALRDVTGLLNEAVSRGWVEPTTLALTPKPEWRYALAVRKDFTIWLDELRYAHEIRSLHVAERAWKRARNRYRWLRLLRLAKDADKSTSRLLGSPAD